MEFELLGWPEAGPKLALDYREFGYAGKFVMSNTGKAVAVERSDERADQDKSCHHQADQDHAGQDRADYDQADNDQPGHDQPGHDQPCHDRADDTSHGRGSAVNRVGEERRDEPAPAPADVEGVVDPDGTVLGAVAFNEDRTDARTAWLRYVTVRGGRRGEGIGPRLASFTADRLRERGYERVKIAVNNPFAYEALYRAGFAFTGEETGIAELVLVRPAEDRSQSTYQAGFDVFRQRDPEGDERTYLLEKEGADPPDIVDSPVPAEHDG